MLRRSAQIFLGMVVVVTALLWARAAYASHQCGSTCNQFTQEGICTHGCSVPGAAPNPDFRDAESDTRYQNTRSVPARDGTDGGNRAVADDTVRAFDEGDYPVDPNQNNGATTAQQAATQDPGSVQNIPTSGTNSGGSSSGCGNGFECITFSCARCSADRKCENGAGENPQFSFGGASGACNQVDRRPSGSNSTNWEVVSLCDPSCSGGTTSYTTPSYTTPSSHPPEQSLACDAITKSIEKPTLNQAVTFTCKGSFSSDNPVYEFRYKVDGGEYTTVAGVRSSDKKQATADITVNKLGAWEVQCRVCTNDSKSHCTDWGKR